MVRLLKICIFYFCYYQTLTPKSNRRICMCCDVYLSKIVISSPGVSNVVLNNNNNNFIAYSAQINIRI